MVSQVNSIREELTPILLKLFKTLQRKEHSQAHSIRPPLPGYWLKLQASITDVHRHKYPQQNASKLNPTVY